MLSFLARTWFPIALIALFLAVIPGVALVILAMTKGDEAVNQWMQQNLSITYQLALPPALVLAMLFIPPVILVLYFLKLKRKSIQVSSTFLWKKSIEDLHVNSLLQWLRQNVLLVLQLLAILFLIYSLLGLRFHGASSEGRHYIVLIDNSASMSAKDVKPNRLAIAREEALKVIDAAGDNDFGMVIAFNSKATTMQGYTNNRIKLREAVRLIEQTHRPTRFDEALTLIDGLANPVRSTENTAMLPKDEKSGEERTYVLPQGISTTVHLFTDGRYAKISEAALANLGSRQSGNTSLLGKLQMQYHAIGKNDPGNANNVGIVSMSAVRLGAAGTLASNELQVYVGVQNFSTGSARVTLRLEVLIDGKLEQAPEQVLDLDRRVDRKGEPSKGHPDNDFPGGPLGKNQGDFHINKVPEQANVVLHAYLVHADDDFALDDEAWLVLGSVRKARVLIVGERNLILDAFFKDKATLERVSVQQLRPADLKEEAYRKLARSGAVDLVIFDRCAPDNEADLPQANTFFIDQPPPPWRRGDKVLDNPYLIASKMSHMLMRNITSLWEVRIAQAFDFDPANNFDKGKVNPLSTLSDAELKKRAEPAATKIAESGGARPLIFTMRREPYTDLVLAFPLITDKGDLNTNWPLKPSFPLFVLNVVNNLGNKEDAGRSLTVQPGEPFSLRPEAGVKTLTVTSPAGTKTTINQAGRGEFVFGDTERLGLYEVATADNPNSYFAVNLFDSNESAIDPRTELQFGQGTVDAGTSEIHQPRELWKWILLLVLILLVAEWFFYNQRVSI